MSERQNFVNTAASFIGCKESNGTHRQIIDIYNAHKPLARGYKVKYTDSWCATFVSAMAIKCGLTDIIPTECGCEKMIELFEAGGNWIENENRVPTLGEYCFYDWQDDSKNYSTTDNKGWSDHVGIVVEVNGNTFKVVEFNYGGEVKIRTLKVNDRCLRGFGVPKYDAEPKKESEVKYTMQSLRKGSTGVDVTIFESIMKKMGYYTGKIDESFGPLCEKACNDFQEDYPECGTDGKPDRSWGKKCWAKALSLLN